MLWYVLRRLLVMVLLLFVVSFLVFSLLYISPGSPIDTLLGPKPRSPETVAALTREYHLDKPFLQQYGIWLWNALHFHFGDSIQTSLPVADEIKARLPTSIFLGVYAFLITMVSGIGLGILAATRRGHATDRGTVAGVVIALSTPTFVAGLLLLFLFAVKIPIFPAYGKGSGGLDTLWHLTLPAFALALTSCAFVVKHTRSALITVLDQDYIVFARARGLDARRLTFNYSLRNALVPVITISGLVLSGLIVGAVLVEVTFSVPGIGQLLVQSAIAKDIPMIQAVTLLIAALIMIANLVTDVIYMLVDPQIRLGG